MMRRIVAWLTAAIFGVVMLACASGQPAESGTVLETKYVTIPLDDTEDGMPAQRCKLKLQPEGGGKAHWSEELYAMDHPRSCGFDQLIGAEYTLFDDDDVVVEYIRNGTQVKLAPPSAGSTSRVKCVLETTWNTGEVNIGNVYVQSDCDKAQDVKHLPDERASANFQKKAKPADFDRF